MSAGTINLWMPEYIGDYLADTMRLTTKQHGAYLLLLFELWRTGTLRDNDEELALITRLPQEAWRRHRDKLARYFTIANGCWTNSGIERLRERQTKVHQANTERARAAAKRRWGHKQEAADAPGIAQALLDDTKSKSKSKSKIKAKAKPSPNGVETSDIRHSLFRKILSEYWQAKNPSLPQMPWAGRDAKALSELLAALPNLQEHQFAAMLRNRARSAVAHGDRVYLWICNLTRYQEEISAYNRPLSVAANQASRAEINRNAVVDAVHRAAEWAEACANPAGENCPEPATVTDPGMPVVDGPEPEPGPRTGPEPEPKPGPGTGPERRLALVGSSNHRLAPQYVALAQTGTDGPVSHYAAMAVAGRSLRNGIPGMESG